MRSPLVPYLSAAAALAAAVAGPAGRGAREEAEAWRLSLDGRWRFALADNPDGRPEGFFLPEFDASGWGELDVPEIGRASCRERV